MIELRRFALSYLFSCKSKTSIELEEMSFLNNRPLRNFLETIVTHPDFQDIYDFDLAENLLCNYVQDPSVRNLTTYTVQDADNLLQTFHSNLSANVAEHWVLFPLNKAYLSSTVRFSNFAFIAGSYEQKAEVLKKLGKTTIGVAKRRISHVMNTRSLGFVDYPLLAIRIHHQFGHVFHHSRRIAFLSNSILQVIYWAKIYPEYNLPLISQRFNPNISEHMMVYSNEDTRTKSLPFRFNATCKINLDWISEKENQKILKNLYNILVNIHELNPLTLRFYKSLIFFKKAIESEEREDMFEGIGLPLLNLTIAAETILLATQDQKRAGLSSLIPRLVKFTDISPEDCSLLVNDIYTWRSEYVHGGSETYHDFNDDFSPGITTIKFINFKRSIASLICRAPYFINMMQKRSHQNPINILDSWFKYLKNHWVKGKKYNPANRYNVR